MGLDFGMLGKEGGKLRAPSKKEKKTQISQKRRKMISMSSGVTNGLSSSLVFTPVQGIELANPTQQNPERRSSGTDSVFSEFRGFKNVQRQLKGL